MKRILIFTLFAITSSVFADGLTAEQMEHIRERAAQEQLADERAKISAKIEKPLDTIGRCRRMCGWLTLHTYRDHTE